MVRGVVGVEVPKACADSLWTNDLSVLEPPSQSRSLRDEAQCV